MKILINHTPIELPQGATIADALTDQNIPAEGTAVAVGDTVVPRNAWHTFRLEDGMHLTVIRAVCGG